MATYNPNWTLDFLGTSHEDEDETQRAEYDPTSALPFEEEATPIEEPAPVPEPAQELESESEYNPNFSFDDLTARADELSASGAVPEENQSAFGELLQGRRAAIEAAGHSVLAAAAEVPRTIAQNAWGMAGLLTPKIAENVDFKVGDFSAKEFAKDQLEEAAYNQAIARALTTDEPVGQFFTNVLDSIIYMGPTIMVGYLTRNPQAAYNVMGTMVFSSAYTDARNEGRTSEEALVDGGMALALEMGPEKALKVLDDLVFGKGVKDLLMTGVKEAATEGMTSLGTIVDEVVRQGEEAPSPPDAAVRVGKDMLAGFLVGEVMALPGLAGKSKEPELALSPAEQAEKEAKQRELDRFAAEQYDFERGYRRVLGPETQEESLDLDQEPEFLQTEDGTRVPPEEDIVPDVEMPEASPALEEAKAKAAELSEAAGIPMSEPQTEPVLTGDTTESITAALTEPVETAVPATTVATAAPTAGTIERQTTTNDEAQPTTTVKRDTNFKTNGLYNVTLADGSSYRIYRKGNQWYSQTGNVRGASTQDRILGSTKKEAIAQLESEVASAELDSPASRSNAKESPPLPPATLNEQLKTGITLYRGSYNDATGAVVYGDIGAHFSPHEEVARTKTGDTGKLSQFDVQLENPLSVTDEPANGAWHDPSAVVPLLEQSGVNIPDSLKQRIQAFEKSGAAVVANPGNGSVQRSLLNTISTVLQNQGYDAVVYPNKYEGAGTESVIVLNPKSLNTNKGSKQSPRLDKGTTTASAPKVSAIATALRKALGWYSNLITLTNSENLGGAAGKYSPSTGRAFVAVDSGATPLNAVFTAWHELYHRGVDNTFNPIDTTKTVLPDSTSEEVASAEEDFNARRDKLSSVMKLASKNSMIDSMAKAQVELRSKLREESQIGRTRSIEEALVDLGAAWETGNIDELRRRYGRTLADKIESAIAAEKKRAKGGKQSTIGKILSQFADFFRKLLGKADPKVEKFSDAEVFALLKQFKRNIAKPVVSNKTTEKVGTPRTDAATEQSTDPESPQITEATEDSTVITSIDRAGLNESRAARGAEPVGPEETTTIDDIKSEAIARLKEDPQLGNTLRTEIITRPDYVPSAIEIAVMHRALHDLHVENNVVGDKAGKPDIEPATQAEYASQFNLGQAEINDMQDAINLAIGRLGRGMRYLQEELTNEFSEENMMRRLNVVYKGKPPTEAVKETKAKAAEIAKINEEAETQARADAGTFDKAEAEAIIKELTAQVKGLEKEIKSQPRVRASTKPELLKKWETKADASRRALEAALKGGRFNAIPLDLMAHAVNIGAYEIANGAHEFGQWVAAFKKNVGAELFKKMEGDINDIYQESRDAHAFSETTLKTEGKKKVLAKAHASVLAGEALPHKQVYELVRYLIQSGISGETNLMNAAHEELRQFLPDLTVREVRQAFVNYGKAQHMTQDEVKAKLAEARALVKMQEDIDRLQEGKDPLSSGRKRPRLTDRVRARKKQLELAKRMYEHKHPHTEENRLIGVNERRAKILSDKIAAVKKQLETGKRPPGRYPVEDTAEVTHLRYVLEELQDQLAHQTAANKMSQQEYDTQVANRLRREQRRLQRRLAQKDFRKMPRKEFPRVSPETRKLQFEVNELKSEWLLQQYIAQEKQKPWYSRASKRVLRTAAITRAVKTSLDLSAFGRQGAIALAANPRMIGKAAATQLQAAMSAEKAFQINYDILHSELGVIAKNAGVFFNDPHSTRPDQQEEAFMDVAIQSHPAFKYLGTAMSARAYNTGLNVIRYEYFKKLVNDLTVNGVPLTEAELKHLAYWVNRATGRGEAKGADAMLAVPFFAPRWVQSRFSILSGWPLISAAKVSPRMFTKILKEYIKAGSGLATLLILMASALALASGDDVDEWDDLQIGLDPSSADFLKFRVGDTRVDLMAGLAQTATFMYRLGALSPLLRQDVDRASVEAYNIGGRFVRSKLSPLASAATNIGLGEDYFGQKLNIVKDSVPFADALNDTLNTPSISASFINETYEMPIPLAWSEILDGSLENEHPLGMIIALQAMSVMGAGVQTYSTKSKGGATEYLTAGDGYLEGAMYESSGGGY